MKHSFPTRGSADMRAIGVAVFGPGAAAARLEGSKGFTKDLCARAGIPTAAYVRATSAEEAHAVLEGFTIPVVIKPDGLAAGKGVIIAETRDGAAAATDDPFAAPVHRAGTGGVSAGVPAGESAASLRTHPSG